MSSIMCLALKALMKFYPKISLFLMTLNAEQIPKQIKNILLEL